MFCREARANQSRRISLSQVSFLPFPHDVLTDFSLEHLKPNPCPTCDICFEPFQVTHSPISAALTANSSTKLPFGLRLPCPGKHPYCISCLTEYINGKIDPSGNGEMNTHILVFPIPCPGCPIAQWGSGIQDEVAEKVLDRESLGVWVCLTSNGVTAILILFAHSIIGNCLIRSLDNSVRTQSVRYLSRSMRTMTIPGLNVRPVLSGFVYIVRRCGTRVSHQINILPSHG